MEHKIVCVLPENKSFEPIWQYKKHNRGETENLAIFIYMARGNQTSLWWDNLILYVGEIRVTWATELRFLINMQMCLVRHFKNQIRSQSFYRRENMM